jgi:hypothetical protein
MNPIELVPTAVDRRVRDRALDREHAAIRYGLARNLAPLFDRHPD